MSILLGVIVEKKIRLRLVARNSYGEVCGAKAIPIISSVSTNVTEAWAIERSVIFASQMSFSRVSFKSDSLRMIKALRT